MQNIYFAFHLKRTPYFVVSIATSLVTISRWVFLFKGLLVSNMAINKRSKSVRKSSRGKRSAVDTMHGQKGRKNREKRELRARRRPVGIEEELVQEDPEVVEEKAEVQCDFRDRAVAIREELCRPQGQLASFDDVVNVLRIYSNVIMKKRASNHTAAIKFTADALQMGDTTVRHIIQEYDTNGQEVYCTPCSIAPTRGTGSKAYVYEHMKIQKEMLISCHDYIMNELRVGVRHTYADLHRYLENQFDIKVSYTALRKRMCFDFDYVNGVIPYNTTSVKITLQIRRFMLLYSGTLLLKKLCYFIYKNR